MLISKNTFSLQCLIFGCLILIVSFNASALPSFARQTGQNCSSCHVQSFGPDLTPMGRQFKLGGYTMGGGSGLAEKMPALSGMITGSFTNTQKNQDPTAAGLQTGYNQNNNFTFDEASMFYAGRIYGKVGAFSQLTYNGYENKLEMDNTDIRFADRLDFDDSSLPFDLDLTYGISLNNNPTVQDLWNTTPVWGFPYTSSGVQPSVGSTPLIDGTLGSQVGGATAYTMINNLLYLEAGAYGTFSSSSQTAFGTGKPDQLSLNSPAPYWRVALQNEWKGHYFELGQYGMIAQTSLPGRDISYGTNDYTDVAVDATYQYLANLRHIVELKTTYIYENQNLAASRNQVGDISTGNTFLNTYKVNVAYTYLQTYGITFAYNNINGSRGPVIDPTGPASDAFKPNSQFYTAELVYVPFGKSSAYSYLMNLRTSLQYIGYSQANGNTSFAQNNNTFMVNGWLAF